MSSMTHHDAHRELGISTRISMRTRNTIRITITMSLDAKPIGVDRGAFWPESLPGGHPQPIEFDRVTV